MRTWPAFFIEITGIGSKVKRADESQKNIKFPEQELDDRLHQVNRDYQSITTKREHQFAIGGMPVL